MTQALQPISECIIFYILVCIFLHTFDITGLKYATKIAGTIIANAL